VTGGYHRFEGDVAVVTGAGSGIGAAVARAFATEGATVVLVDQHRETALAVCEEIAGAGGQGEVAVLDVSDGDQVEWVLTELVGRLRRVDVLVNNASIAGGDGLAKLPPDEWDRDVAVTLRGAFLCTRAVLPSMLERGTGCIVNVASVNGLLHLGQEAYSAAKAGLLQMTRSVAVQYGPRGIRANAVAPGTVRTPAWSERLERDPQIFDRLARWYPLQRVGEPEDVARAVLFLASVEASWITGATLPVDGGLLAGNLRLALELLGEADSDGEQ
jgi:meso-butanediol dehydrogenase / (S,S)-butanediol dehydrogenase / diacetyl reductase